MLANELDTIVLRSLSMQRLPSGILTLCTTYKLHGTCMLYQ